MSSVQSQPFFLPHKILLLERCFQSCPADAAKIVTSRVPLSPRLVTLPLRNKDVIEIPSQCTRKELGSAFCNKKPWRTCCAYSRQQQGHSCKHLEGGLVALNRVRTSQPTLRWKTTQAVLMKYEPVRFNLHRPGIK